MVGVHDRQSVCRATAWRFERHWKLGGGPVDAGAPLGAGAGGAGAGSPPGGPRRRSPVGWILAAVAAVIVVALVSMGVLIVRNRDLLGPPYIDPVPSPSAGIVCPPTPSQSPSATPDQGGRVVTSGHLSYPRLSTPFSAPSADPRTPFGRDVQSQTAVVEEAANGNAAWVAGVLIARLLAGDGFYGPEQGAAVVAECVVGKFYGDNPVNRKDLRSQLTRVDGHDGWLLEMHLTFDIPGIETKGRRPPSWSWTPAPPTARRACSPLRSRTPHRSSSSRPERR